MTSAVDWALKGTYLSVCLSVCLSLFLALERERERKRERGGGGGGGGATTKLSGKGRRKRRREKKGVNGKEANKYPLSPPINYQDTLPEQGRSACRQLAVCCCRPLPGTSCSPLALGLAWRLFPLVAGRTVLPPGQAAGGAVSPRGGAGCSQGRELAGKRVLNVKKRCKCCWSSWPPAHLRKYMYTRSHTHTRTHTHTHREGTSGSSSDTLR